MHLESFTECKGVASYCRVIHFSQNEKYLLDQAVLHYFYYADFKNVKISNFDGIFPFPLAVQSFST